MLAPRVNPSALTGTERESVNALTSEWEVCKGTFVSIRLRWVGAVTETRPSDDRNGAFATFKTAVL